MLQVKRKPHHEGSALLPHVLLLAGRGSKEANMQRYG
jgi:hypothetical protein